MELSVVEEYPSRMVPGVLVARAVEPEARFVFSYRLDFWTQYWITQDSVLRRRRSALRLSLLIALIYSSFYFYSTGGLLAGTAPADIASTAGLLIPIVVVSVLIGFGASYVTSFINTILVRLLTRSWRGWWQLTLAEDGLHADQPTGAVHVTWESVRGVRTTRRNVFFPGILSTLVVPIKAFGSQQRQREALAFAQARMGWAVTSAASVPRRASPGVADSPDAAYAPPASMASESPYPVTESKIPDRQSGVVARALVRHTRASLTKSMVPAMLRNRRFLIVMTTPLLFVGLLSRTTPAVLFTLALLPFSVTVALVRGQTRLLKLMGKHPAVYDFTDDGVRMWIPGQSSECTWDRIPRCVERRDAFVVYLPAGSYLAVPKSALESPMEVAALRTLVASRLGGRVRLRGD
jgi:hypothetical protein